MHKVTCCIHLKDSYSVPTCHCHPSNRRIAVLVYRNPRTVSVCPVSHRASEVAWLPLAVEHNTLKVRELILSSNYGTTQKGCRQQPSFPDRVSFEWLGVQIDLAILLLNYIDPAIVMYGCTCT